MTGTETRHARRSLRIRKAIERAALEFALEKGFENTTVAEIAERADVAVRTVYGRFETKDAIVLTGLVGIADDLIDVLRHGPGSTLDRLAAALLPERGTGEDSLDIFWLRMRAVVVDSYLGMHMRRQLERVEEAFAEAFAVEADLSPDDVGARACAAAAVGVLLDIQRRFVEAPQDDTALRSDAQRGLHVLRAAVAALT